MKKVVYLCCVALVGSVAVPAVAQDRQDDARLKVGVTGGTLGVGPEVSYRVSETIGVRANATFLSISRDIDSDDITYDASLDLQSGGLMLDVYPFGGGFRISGGARINENEASGVGSPNAGTSFEINGTTYTAAEIGTLTATTDIKSFAPALTLGYGGGLSRGLVFGIEAGVLFQGSAQVQPLSFTGLCAQSSPPASCSALVADLEAERAGVNEDLDGFKLYPILQFSIGYRF